MWKSKGGLELHNYIKELKMHEKDLYPAVETFLKTQKNCIAEYVGTELSQKRGENQPQSRRGLEYQMTVKALTKIAISVWQTQTIIYADNVY